uniref:Uncharacterized protein n=1 Tax=Romanomermis culicivorax TaxID=13658 RepID=A0A915IJV1_ROMCU
LLGRCGPNNKGRLKSIVDCSRKSELAAICPIGDGYGRRPMNRPFAAMGLPFRGIEPFAVPFALLGSFAVMGRSRL